MLSIRYLTIFSFLLTMGITSSINAQDAESVSDGRLGIEEIIVTGTKRDISQQDVPIAVSTITEQQLENTFRNDVFALGQLAPNVTLTPQNGFNAIAGGMRGTGFISILVTKDPSVGIVVDGEGCAVKVEIDCKIFRLCWDLLSN